jgi:hypothetical protein
MNFFFFVSSFVFIITGVDSNLNDTSSKILSLGYSVFNYVLVDAKINVSGPDTDIDASASAVTISDGKMAIALLLRPSMTAFPDNQTQIFIFYKFFLNRYQCQFHCMVTRH